MKLKFETCYQLKIGVNNVDVFVDKYVIKRKFCGLLLSTWENISGQMITLCLLTASCAGILGIVYDCGKDIVLFTFLMGAAGSVLLVFVDNLVNIEDHKKILKLNLNDYFENYLKVRLEREHFYPEELSKYRQEYFSSVADSSIQLASAKEESNLVKTNQPEAKQEKELARSKKADKKESRVAKKEARKEAKIKKVEAKNFAKLAKKEARILAKQSKKEKNVAAKLAKVEARKQAANVKKEALQKEKEDRLMTQLQKKEEEKRRKNDSVRNKEEKTLSQQKAYQYKMRLKEEKEAEKKRQEALLKERAELEKEKKIGKEDASIPDNAEDIIEEIKRNIANEASSMAKEELSGSPKTVQKAGTSKTEEDKLIEEVLREFLA